MGAMAGDSAFLSLVRWPEKMDRDDLVAALAEVAGIDPFHAGQRLARGTAPLVIQRIDATLSGEIVKQLRARGVPAIAPTASQLRSFAPAIRAKRLVPAIGAPEPMYMCEPWREEGFGFLGKDIAIMVRARLGKMQTGPARTERVGTSYEPITGTVYAEYEAVRDVKTSLNDILDIYLKDRRRVRVSGDKFNFDVLGKGRGYSDNENIDKLSVMLAKSAPRAIVDLGFGEFSCPPTVTGAFRTGGGGTVKDEHPAFDFYSPWVVQVYRALASGER